MSNTANVLKVSRSFEEKSTDDHTENNNNNNYTNRSRFYTKTSYRLDKNFLPIHQGFLTKQGGAIKSWRKRFFTLRTNNVLYYYRDVSKDPQGEIDLKDESLNIRGGTCEDGCWSKIPLERTIVVETTNRKYYLFSETVIEAVSWLGMLRDVTSKQNCQTHKAKSSTLPGMLGVILELLNTDCTYLMCRSTCVRHLIFSCLLQVRDGVLPLEHMCLKWRHLLPRHSLQWMRLPASRER